uniref:Uncharacterized protein n=1 Tax=Gracilinema caldarium TaxID=215591 RepID=A0A7C3IGY2_9SPIR
MKTRVRELAKPGIFGSADNPQIVTERELQEIAETFPEIGKAPVTFGHWPDPARPRLGNVISVTWDPVAKVLSGTIEEQDELAKAVDEGYYPDVSIGAKRRAVDGKMYLHHLAYLGEEPPAIKDLVAAINKELMPDIAASDFDGAISLPDPKTKLLPRTESPVQPTDSPPAQEQKSSSGLSLSDSGAGGSVRADAASLEAQLRALKKEALLRSAQGRVPKAKEPILLALADSLDVRESLELSDDTGLKRMVSAIDLLADLLASLPQPVAEGRLQLSDPEPIKPINMKALHV